MSRFGNLEFGSPHRHSQGHQQGVQKDQSHFLEQAREAFEGAHFEQALRSYAKALEFNSSQPEASLAWIGQVRSLIELGEFEEAKVWADKALLSFPNDPELLAAKGVALARCGDLQGAISFSDAAVESQQNTPYIWLARGDVLLARKEKRADFCFEKAFSLGSKSWTVLWLASRIQSFYEHFAKALKLAQEALSLEPARAAVWLQLGQCQLALGLAPQAQNSFEQARELDPASAVEGLLSRASETGFLDKMAGRWRQWFGK
jgi:tetratricopeptide (TPR) repeat protein